MNTFRSRSTLALLGVLLLHAALLHWLLFTPSLIKPFAKRPDPVAVTIIVQPLKPEPPPEPPRPTARQKPSSAKARVVQAPLPQETAQQGSAASTSAQGAQEAGEQAGESRSAEEALAITAPSAAVEDRSSLTPLPINEAARQPESTVPVNAAKIYDGVTLSLGSLSAVSSAREFQYIGYLNGNAVARASYLLERKDIGHYQASFRVQATGITAWLWRGERVDSSFGSVTADGFVPQRMRQQQAARPPREQTVPAGTLDLVSIVFQLSELGRHFPTQLIPGFVAQVRVQKISRVDIMKVEVLATEPLLISGRTHQSVPIQLSELNAESANPNKQIIWFVPDLDWAPMRLSVPTGNYQVEFRSPEMAAVQSVKESP